jgi:lipoate-protein ligase A
MMNDECGMMNAGRIRPALPQPCPAAAVRHSSFCIHHSSFPAALRLLLDPPAPGAWNMAVDEALLEAAAAEGQCTLRFYRWQRPTLSLGYFQTYTDRWQHAASSHAAVVRRASGGGAILHDAELTYSFAIPDRHPLAIDRLGFYRAAHTALIAALAQWGIAAAMCASPRPAPTSRGGSSTSWGGSCTAAPDQTNVEIALQRQPFLCFQRRSPGDVLVGGVKIAGSAQRRCRGAVLQHGSVLLARSPATPELDGLKDLTGKTIEPEQLAAAWLAQLVGAFHWESGRLSNAEHCRATTLAAEKYAAADWTENRRRREIL